MAEEKEKPKPKPVKSTPNDVRKRHKIERVSVGIGNLDGLIEGGFKRRSINLVVGSPGCGKTIFAIQYLVEGMKKGESALYVTFEESKDRIYEDMARFGWDLEKYEKEGKFVFLEYTPEQVKKVLIEGGGVIESLIQKYEVKRLVIDSITSFALLYKDELAQKESALALFELIDRWGCTAMLTSQEKLGPELHVSAALEFEVDTLIILYHVKNKGIRTRGIEVLKMRGTKTPEKTYGLVINDSGVTILTDKICYECK